MFTFTLSKGSKSALDNPSQVVISSEMSTKFFGEADALGKELKVIFGNGKSRVFIVGGVAEAFPVERTFYPQIYHILGKENDNIC